MKIVFILLFLPFSSWAQVYLLSGKAPATPQLFGEGTISTQLQERDMAITANGKEMYYTIQIPAAGFSTIVYRKLLPNGTWSKPEVASFSGQYSDLEPALSADGKKLYFSSNRPLQEGQAKDYDIWVTEKINTRPDGREQWSTPRNLGRPVNTEADEYYPSIANNGNLYFTAAYKKGYGKEDIYLATFTNNRYNEPLPLDSAINTPFYEFNAFIDRDEQFILFTSYGRKDDTGRGDLYISLKNAAGTWQPARNLSLINSSKLDYCPFVSFDKKILYFTSERTTVSSFFSNKAITYRELQALATSATNGNSNVYRIDFEKVLEFARE